MNVDNYTYINLSNPLITFFKVKTNVFKPIENIDIDNEAPNLLIFNPDNENRYEKINYNNIYPTVKILLTNKYGLTNGLWKKIPEFIEYIIVNCRIYKNDKNKLNFLFFETNENKREIIEQIIIEEKFNDVSIYEYYGPENFKIKETTVVCDETALMQACIDKKNTDLALKLIDKMSDMAINKWNIRGQTALLICCKNGLIDIANKLIDRMSIEAISKICTNNSCALTEACRNNMIEFAHKIIDKDYNKKDMYLSALYSACANNMNDVVIKLLNRINPYDLNKKRIYIKLEIFKFACKYNMINVALRLINMMDDVPTLEESINEDNRVGESFLHWACFYNMEEVAIKLINNKNKIDRYYHFYETIPLHWACEKKMSKVAIMIINQMKPSKIYSILLDEEIDKISISDTWGNTALIYACKNNMIDVALELIKRMDIKSINKKNNNKINALYYAEQNNMIEIIKLIKK